MRTIIGVAGEKIETGQLVVYNGEGQLVLARGPELMTTVVMQSSSMSPESACALLHQLADINVKMGNVIIPINDEEKDDVLATEQRIIVELLTCLLGRHPEDHEIQAATAM